MSYGAFVQACVDERRGETLRGYSWEASASKYANDHLPDYPEDRVLETLRDLRWPDRPVSFGEIYAAVKRRVSPEEVRAWRIEMDGWQP